MRLLFIVLGLACVAGCSQTQKVTSTSMSSSVVEGVHATQAAGLLDEGDKLFSQRAYDEARAKYATAVEEATGPAGNSTLTEAEAQIARCYGIQGKFEEGRPWLAKAKSHATDKEPRGWSRYLGVRGRFEWQDEKNNEKAKATFIEMYDYCKKHELFSRELDAAHMVAIVAPPAEQVEWALKAVEAAEKGNETGWLAVLWNNLGWTYEERGSFDKMLDALIKAREYHYEVGNEQSKMIADFGVGRAYWRNNDNAKAREWIEGAFEKARQQHAADPENTEKGEWVGWGHIYLADILDSEGKKAEALEQYKAGRPYIVAAGIENWWPEQLQKLDDKIAELEADD
jgi:tetratricopeptide (TPR) repeat protein